MAISLRGEYLLSPSVINGEVVDPAHTNGNGIKQVVFPVVIGGEAGWYKHGRPRLEYFYRYYGRVFTARRVGGYQFIPETGCLCGKGGYRIRKGGGG